MRTLPWLLAIGALILAGYLGYRAQRAEERAQKAEAVIENQERLAASAEGFQPAVFVRLDREQLTYRVPREVQVEGQTFVNQIESSAALAKDINVFGPRVQGDARTELGLLRENAPISIKLSEDETTVEAIYIP